MFKNILIPTDGSKLALKGAKAGIRLAKALGARVTAVYVIPPFIPVASSEASAYAPMFTLPDYRRASEAAARKALEAVAAQAEQAHVMCRTRFLTAPKVHEGILKVARGSKCDAIAMVSHGRGAVVSALLGSVTNRVLAHSKLPVLVTR